MSKIKANIKNLKSILLMLMVLFILAPCSVKATVINTDHFAYETPLNLTKTTLQFNQCQSLTTVEHSKTSFEIAKSIVYHPALNSVQLAFLNQKVKQVVSNDSEIVKSNTPPKYILFKRLKVALT